MALDARSSALDTGVRTAPITVTGGRFSGQAGPTLILGGSGATLSDTAVSAGTAATAAIDLHAPLTAHRIHVNAAATALRLTGGSTAVIDHSAITAGTDGVSAGPRTSARLIDTTVDAGRPSRGPVTFIGSNRYSHEPLRWLAVAALIAVAAAVALETLRRLREREQPTHGSAPEHVLNAQ